MSKINKSYYEKYISIMGTIGNSMFYFQAYKIFISKNAIAISFLGFLISFIALSSWLIYGVILKNKPLIIANIFGIIGALLVLIEIIIYGENIFTI